MVNITNQIKQIFKLKALEREFFKPRRQKFGYPKNITYIQNINIKKYINYGFIRNQKQTERYAVETRKQ